MAEKQLMVALAKCMRRLSLTHCLRSNAPLPGLLSIMGVGSGVCGYATTVGNCTVMTMQQFCANSTLKPLTFNGGLSAAPQGNLGLLVLAL